MSALIPDRSYLNISEYLSINGVEFFDTPDFVDFPENNTDRFIVIDSKYSGRLDLIAYDYLNDENLWWIIALANDLRDIPCNVFPTRKIRIPSEESVSEYIRKYTK